MGKSKTSEQKYRRKLILKNFSLTAVIITASGILFLIINYFSKRGTNNFVPLFLSGLLLFSVFITLYFINQIHYRLRFTGGIFLIATVSTCLLIISQNDLMPELFFIGAGFLIIITALILGTRLALSLTSLMILAIIVNLNLPIALADSFNNLNAASSPSPNLKIAWLFFLSLIGILSALYNHEVARLSRRLLLKEDILLNAKRNWQSESAKLVTKIKQENLNRLDEIYRFAEFGRLSAGIFHDLINPLMAVNLNLAQVESADKNKGALFGQALGRARKAAGRLEDFVLVLRRQLKTSGSKSYFAPALEIKQVLQIINHRLLKNNLSVNFYGPENLRTYGDALRFSQAILNLLSNAIEAYENLALRRRRPITIKLTTRQKYFILSLKDYGAGIKPENLKKIFEPFFSTKVQTGASLGIGLSSVKKIIEVDFHGRLKVKSVYNHGTEFTLIIPLNHQGDLFEEE